MNNKEQAFLAELAALLIRYNATIGFTCDDSSDIDGLIDEGIVIDMDKYIDGRIQEITIYKSDAWWITPRSLLYELQGTDILEEE